MGSYNIQGASKLNLLYSLRQPFKEISATVNRSNKIDMDGGGWILKNNIKKMTEGMDNPLE